MKSLIYKNPLLSAIIINSITLFICIYSIFKTSIFFMPIMVFVGIINRKIIDNGKGLNRKKKILIHTSFFLMLIVFLAYGSYIHDLRDMEITNRY
jgi:hypothetical protein